MSYQFPPCALCLSLLFFSFEDFFWIEILSGKILSGLSDGFTKETSSRNSCDTANKRSAHVPNLVRALPSSTGSRSRSASILPLAFPFLVLSIHPSTIPSSTSRLPLPTNTYPTNATYTYNSKSSPPTDHTPTLQSNYHSSSLTCQKHCPPSTQ